MKNKNSIILTILGCLFLLPAESYTHIVLLQDIANKNFLYVADSLPTPKKAPDNPFISFTSAYGTDRNSQMMKVILDGKEIHPDSINEKTIDVDKIERIEASMAGDSTYIYLYTEEKKPVLSE